MRPIKFKECNKVYAENQPEYIPLPVYEDADQGGRVIHCWQLSFVERIKILFKGRLWVSVLNFGQPLQPISIETDNPFSPAPNAEKE
jgi:hypothetical protein